jgi:hypothetical protein
MFWSFFISLKSIPAAINFKHFNTNASELLFRWGIEPRTSIRFLNSKFSQSGVLSDEPTNRSRDLWWKKTSFPLRDDGIEMYPSAGSVMHCVTGDCFPLFPKRNVYLSKVIANLHVQFSFSVTASIESADVDGSSGPTFNDNTTKNPERVREATCH